ncbi:MAG: gamma-butyrobetaine hydroxylase-like domain-containing protein [Phycisphaerales bacterium JB050]
MTDAPANLNLVKDQGLTIDWADGSRSYYPIAYLRKMSPSAEARKLREDLAKNPLTVLPTAPKRGGANSGPLVATSAELVGHYAIRIRFSDGHDTGIYSWQYLREIDPDRPDTLENPSR